MAIVNLLIEGEIDEIVAQKIIGELGHQIGTSYGKKGSGYIKNKIQDFNKSAQSICYLALVDLDKYNCPPEVILSWLPHKNNLMIFRVVVREIESWLLADRNNIAKFLNFSVDKIPTNPENENDPKQKLVNIARNSRSSQIRSSLVPEKNSTAQVGKLYTSEMKRFVSEFWDINSARVNSPSLNKCFERLREI